MTIWSEIQARSLIWGKDPPPQILLDIDDTLIDCRHRKHKVFMDFLEQNDLKKRFPIESVQLSALPWQSVCYRIDDNLRAAQIDNHEFQQELLRFWRSHYFTYPYLMNDQPFPGAISFVKSCQNLGLRIVYLTGRDVPGMQKGTLDRMAQLGFPVNGPQIHFHLKPNANQDDHQFKLTALDTLALQGPVLAALENELGNLNAMAEKFEDALVYWRPTLYAPQPPAPHPRVKILQHFPRTDFPLRLKPGRQE